MDILHHNYLPNRQKTNSSYVSRDTKTTYCRTCTCSNLAEWMLGRSHIRHEMYLIVVDIQHSKTFSNVMLVSKLSTLITSHILLRFCQSYLEQILPIYSISLSALLLSKKRLKICNVRLKSKMS